MTKNPSRPRVPYPALSFLILALSLPIASVGAEEIGEGEETRAAEVAPAPSDALRLRVNIPAYRLDAIVDGEVLASFPVTVGAAHEPTPDGRFLIDRVIWNPWWHPPAHRRPKDQVTPPGPRNPMGRVKLHFAADLYYVHGTAKTNQLRTAASRGCIRLGNEDALAVAALVQDLAGPDLEEAELERLLRDSSRTRNLELEHPVPLEVVYEVVEVQDRRVSLHDDVYGRWAGVPTDELVHAALSSRGIDLSFAETRSVAAALEESSIRQVVLDFDSGEVAPLEVVETRGRLPERGSTAVLAGID